MMKEKIEKMAADPANPKWLRHVAVLTGVLAAVSGYLSVRGNSLSNDVIYHSNQGVLFQAQSSDAWNEYQATSVKARIVETALLTTRDAEVLKKLDAQDKELRDRQPAIKKEAQDLADKRDAELKNGARFLHEKDTLSLSTVSIQLAIALASVAALAKRRSIFTLSIGLGVMGVLIAAWAIVGHYCAIG